jgi:hypothetical protein
MTIHILNPIDEYTLCREESKLSMLDTRRNATAVLVTSPFDQAVLQVNCKMCLARFLAEANT